MSVTALVLHNQNHPYLFGAINSLLSQSVGIEKIIILNSTGKSINKDLPKGNIVVVGKEPSNNYMADVNMILPSINTEYLLLVESKNLFYKSMVDGLKKRLDKYEINVAAYCDFDLLIVNTNQNIRAYLPSYDSRYIMQGIQPLPNLLFRTNLLKKMYPFDNWIKIVQNSLLTQVPHSLYMERSFEQPGIQNNRK